MVLYRLAMFMTSESEVLFSKIALYQNGMLNGWFYCRFVSKDAISINDFQFLNFAVEKYIPRILNNIATDSGNMITRSIPLGHLMGKNFDFSP